MKQYNTVACVGYAYSVATCVYCFCSWTLSVTLCVSESEHADSYVLWNRGLRLPTTVCKVVLIEP